MLFWEGMIFEKIGRVIDGVLWLIVLSAMLLFCSVTYAVDNSEYWAERLAKPVFRCLICMSSLWTVIIGHYCFGMSSLWTVIMPALIVCGMNVFWDSIINYYRNGSN